MANEIHLMGYPSGETMYAIVRNSSGQVAYSVSEEFEDWGSGSRSHTDYDIPLTDKSGGLYLADFPSWIPANTSVGYRTIIYMQVGSSPASTDHVVGGQVIKWTGSAAAADAIEQNVTAIANRMVYKVGGTMTDLVILDIDDDTDENAVRAKAIYTQVRNEVLLEWPWNDCREFADLGAEVTGLTMADWEYVFALPTDFIAMVAQIDEDSRTVKFKHEVRGPYLFTNEYSNSDGDSAYINYIKKLTDASLYRADLFEAIATKWAAEMAPLWNPKEKDNLKREYEYLVLPKAKAANQESQYSDDEGSYSWKEARTG